MELKTIWAVYYSATGTTAKMVRTVAEALAGWVPEVLPMRLQEKYFDLPEQKDPPKPRPLFG